MVVSEDERTEPVKVGNLNTYSKRVNTIVKVVSKTEPREVTSRKDMSTHGVAEALVGDETGSIYLTLWDDNIERVEEGQTLNIKDAYVNLFRGSMRLNISTDRSIDSAKEIDDTAVEAEEDTRINIYSYLLF